MFVLRRNPRSIAERGRRESPCGRSNERRALLAGLALLLAASSRPAFCADGAAPPPDLAQPLSLEQVVRLAVERNLSILVARQGEAQARGSSRASLSGLLPDLNGSVGYSQRTSKYGGTAINQQTGQQITGSFQHNWNLGLQGSVNLLSLPAWYEWSGARRGVEAAQRGTEDQVATVVLQAKQQYYALLRSGELARVTRESYTLRQEQLRRAQSLFELGSVPRSDVLQAQVNVATAERDRIAAENAIEQERARLAVLLALPVSAPLEVRELPAIEDSVQVESEESLRRQAEANLPALRQARLEVAAARSSELAARTRLLPAVRADYSYGKQEKDAGDLTSEMKKNASWGYSVGLSAPIFDAFQIRGAAQRATAQRRVQERNLDTALLQAALGVRESRLAILNAAQTLRSAREGVRLTEESVRLQTALYESGGGTLLELNNAQVELTRARVAVVEADANLRSARAALERAIGAPTGW